MRLEMELDKENRAGDGRVFVILEGQDCSLRYYARPSDADLPNFGQVYEVEVREAD